MISIFSNMMISSRERLEHLKDSFNSLTEISDNWLINIRGKYREEAIEFLKAVLGDKLVLFQLLDESRGWFRNSLDMIKEAKYDYIFLCMEDHINLAPQNLYGKIVAEMKAENADYLMYSWWLNGKAREAFEVSELKMGQYIDTVYLTKKIWQKQLAKGYRGHLISLLAIFKKDFLIKRMEKELIKWPRSITTFLFFAMITLDRIGIKFDHRRFYDFLNRLVGGKLTKAIYGPFELEKSPFRFDVLPFKMALPKQELLACIDDDLKTDGYQLIKRGLYPVRFDLKIDNGPIKNYDWGKMEILEENDFYSINKIYLDSGKIYNQRHYQKDYRIDQLPRETIVNLGGDLKVRVSGQEIILKKEESVSFYPNLNHEITALAEGGVFISATPKAVYN